MCIHCDEFGHCPMRFWDSNQHIGSVYRCLCHSDFNLCVVDLESDIPYFKEGKGGDEAEEEIEPGVTATTAPTTTTTTPEPEVVEAFGFEVKK